MMLFDQLNRSACHYTNYTNDEYQTTNVHYHTCTSKNMPELNIYTDIVRIIRST